MFHSFVNPAERIVTIDREMTRTRYSLKATNQSKENDSLSRGISKWLCPWGIVCKSSQANWCQRGRSSDSDTGELDDGTEDCYKTSSPWHVMKKLQLNTSTTNGGHFLEACFNETSEQYSCLESCDGVYRSFTGCCNNLDNKEYGQIIKFDSSNVLEFHY